MTMIKTMNVRDIKTNKLLLRDILTDEQAARAKTAYDRFGRFLGTFRSFEHWEASFLTEGNVDRELGVYETLSRAFDLADPKDPERTATARMLLGLSLHLSHPRVAGLSRRVQKRVAQAFQVAMAEHEAKGLGDTYLTFRPTTQEEREAIIRLN
jgi:hypothetical protein